MSSKLRTQHGIDSLLFSRTDVVILRRWLCHFMIKWLWFYGFHHVRLFKPEIFDLIDSGFRLKSVFAFELTTVKHNFKSLVDLTKLFNIFTIFLFYKYISFPACPPNVSLIGYNVTQFLGEIKTSCVTRLKNVMNYVTTSIFIET